MPKETDKHQKTSEPELENGMVRGLQNRHVQLIAIAGTIGTGLFLGSGHSIALTGPSIIIVYLLTGLFMFWMMRAMGEMLYYDPDQHTFINFITKYIGKGWGYFAGWSYWVSVIFLGMAEITAVAKYVQYWFPSWPSWIIQIVFLLILSSVNLIAVRVFGEAEFWFAMIKIIAILALIATAVFMLLTGFKTSQGPVSLTNISHHFEMFPKGWVRFIMSFQMVFFAYQAIEFVGITVSETQNPRKVLPKAIQEIPMRIVIFYVGALLAIMTIFPWRGLPEDTSPFVMVFKLAGIKWAAALINFVVLTSAASALNSTLYSTGRHLYQIANEAPNKFMTGLKIGTLSKTGVPSRAIIFSAIVIAISAFINVLPGVKDAFALITASSSGVYIAIYVLTMFAHLKYRRSKDFMPDGYLMPHYKILNPITTAFMIFVFITLFLQDSTYIGAIGATIWIVVFGIYSLYKFRNDK
ncbi:amino acid permease [Streptococcus macacae]|uniref:Amino acid permease n=1 Tax=Streptococcus macacae NCTC 11558 TaxID=764298 RepID=G5JVM7_9STRE|nr:amino acid permease [Streptococcus macacae]EHJ52092.1 amino acid permease [Streptococcus macacae NCTC 11558]SUN78695.1 putative amino acid permease [Streptococcus macacae NCTC 11558]